MSDSEPNINEADESNGSPNIHPITWDDQNRLGIDECNQLYWNGKQVEIKKRLQLTTFERILAMVGIFGAFLWRGRHSGWRVYAIL